MSRSSARSLGRESRHMSNPYATKGFPTHAIAVIGMAGRFPGAPDIESYRRLIANGVDAFQAFSDAEMDVASVPDALRRDPAYVRGGVHLADADMFDAGFFGMSPREAQILDPQHRLFLECCWEALETAGYAREPAQRAVGVYAGCSMNTYLLAHILRSPQLTEAVGGYQLMLANDKDFLCTRASYQFDLRGPSMTLQTACSTSLVAVVEACRALARGECDIALAGGVSITFPQRAGYLYQESMILSPDGRCRPFDADARGTRPGAGAGIVVLKRLADALADRDSICGVIRGAAVNNDGAAKAGFTAPSVDGQVEAIVAALALAATPARSIGYIETHGTGTPLGDPIEIAALKRAFRIDTSDVGFCRLGAVKANLGHLDAAAGVAGLIKALLVLQSDAIPPLVNFKRVNPALDIERSPFLLSGEAAPWMVEGPRRAGVSSFGIGGTNAHVVLEQAPALAAAAPVRPTRLLVLSARHKEELDALGDRMADALADASEADLANAEWTLQAGRRDFPHRRAIVGVDRQSLLKDLHAKRGATGHHEGGLRPVAFLFSGQGGQHPGMAAGLYRAESVFRAAFDACADIAARWMEEDLRKLVFKGDSKTLSQTAIAQPALFATSYALSRLWASWGVRPSAMLGHSIGEYAAACIAGVFSLEHALKVVVARGRLMQDMPPGAMAAVNLPLNEAQARIDAADLEIAAENGPDLCVVSGRVDAIDAFVKQLEAESVSARRLRVSHAFHSRMMEPVMKAFEQVVANVQRHVPALPYVSNVTGDWITAEQAVDPAYYAEHLRRPVRFDAGLNAVIDAFPDAALLEVGPARALATLARNSLPSNAATRVVESSPRPDQADQDAATILAAAGKLWTLGALDAPARLNEAAGLLRIALPTYPFNRKRHWVDPSHAPATALPPSALAVGVNHFAITWKRSEEAPAASLHARWLLVEPQASSRGDVLLSALRDAGADAARVSDAADIDKPSEVSGAILLGPMTTAGPAEARRAYHTLVAVAQKLETWNRATPCRILVGGQGLVRVLDERIRDPYAALVFGPVLALQRECPGLRLRYVDVDAEASLAKALTFEARDASSGQFSAWRRGVRFVRDIAPLASPQPASAASALPAGAVVMVFGGLGAIGRAIAGELAQTLQARIIFISRGADAGVKASAIAEIRRLGGDALVFEGDMADPAAVRAMATSAKQAFGALDAVIHAAGSSGVGDIAFFTKDADFDNVVRPKLEGIEAITEALREEPLALFLATGSISGVSGYPGLSAYCGANAVLNAFVESEVLPTAWRRTLCIGWGQWRDIGMAARLLDDQADTDLVDLQKRQQIPPDQALGALTALVAGERAHAIVAMGDVRTEVAAQQAASEAGSVSDKVSLLATTIFETVEERQLAEIWAGLLGVEAFGPDDDFFVFCGHSLLATRVIARIGAVSDARLTLRDVFEAPTIRKLAERMTAARDGKDREEVVL